MNEIHTPIITVLMSCYNAARWLDEAINSVLSQTFRDFEFIIVDDGSKDETLSIVRRAAEQDSRIVIIAKPNTGLADSLNVGIHQARGNWIARIDADDLCEPTRLGKQLATVLANPELVFIGSGLKEIDENGCEKMTYSYPSGHKLLLQNLTSQRKFPPHSSAFYSTKIVREIGAYRPRVRRSQDADLWMRLAEVGEIACLDEPLVKIRKHTNQISNDDLGKQQAINGRMVLTSYYLRQLGAPDPINLDQESFEFFRRWIAMKLEHENSFELESLRKELNLTFHSASNKPAALVKVAFKILSNPIFVWRLIVKKFVGGRLPRQQAMEWVCK
jgi:glycosyltransferase involved in cell wall biosynthesis